MTRVLDLGSGAGKHTLFLAKEGFKVTALDVSETAMGIVTQRLAEAGIRGVKFVIHDMKDLPFPDGAFDAVVCTNVIHHGMAADVKRNLSEVRRVLKSRGRALIVVISTKDFRMGNGTKLENHTYMFTEGDEEGIIHHFFSRKELESYVKQFRTISLKEETSVTDGKRRAHFYALLEKRYLPKKK